MKINTYLYFLEPILTHFCHTKEISLLSLVPFGFVWSLSRHKFMILFLCRCHAHHLMHHDRAFSTFSNPNRLLPSLSVCIIMGYPTRINNFDCQMFMKNLIDASHYNGQECFILTICHMIILHQRSTHSIDVLWPNDIPLMTFTKFIMERNWPTMESFIPFLHSTVGWCFFAIKGIKCIYAFLY